MISRRAFVKTCGAGIVGMSIAAADKPVPRRRMEKSVSLFLGDWPTLLEFVTAYTNEIAEFDDEDEIYLAVMAVVGKIESQLKE